MMYRAQKIRNSARDKACTMQSPRCNGNPATVVWCHSNKSEHGKGMGLKAHDIFGFYGCSGCHHWYDIESRQDRSVTELERNTYYQRAADRSLLIIVQEGILR